MVRPFRFGVSISNAATAEEWRSSALKAEDLGYDTFLVADHIRQSFQPMVALAFAAEATKRIRLGTLVINNDFRHPVLLAREAATLDVLSSGRFELGIGAGHSGDEYREAGIAFDSAKTRVERLAESVQLIRSLWREKEANFEGRHYQVRGHRSYPRPIQPSIPVAVGGNGRTILELAAREADIVGFTGFWAGENGRAREFPHFTSEAFAGRVDIVRRAAGTRLDNLELNVLVQGVDTEAPHLSAESWATRTPFTVEQIVDSPFVLFGSQTQIEEKLLTHRERFGVSYITTFAAGMEALAPLVARLAGR